MDSRLVQLKVIEEPYFVDRMGAQRVTSDPHPSSRAEAVGS
jgi:hypothetical protein